MRRDWWYRQALRAPSQLLVRNRVSGPQGRFLHVGTVCFRSWLLELCVGLVWSPINSDNVIADASRTPIRAQCATRLPVREIYVIILGSPNVVLVSHHYHPCVHFSCSVLRRVEKVGCQRERSTTRRESILRVRAGRQHNMAAGTIQCTSHLIKWRACCEREEACRNIDGGSVSLCCALAPMKQ